MSILGKLVTNPWIWEIWGNKIYFKMIIKCCYVPPQSFGTFGILYKAREFPNNPIPSNNIKPLQFLIIIIDEI